MNGQGTVTWSDGRKSEGEWKNGKEWIIKGFKNEVLVNEWKDGKKIDIKPQVEVVKSEIKILYYDNKKKPWLEYPEGDNYGKYEGEVINNIPNGKSTYTLSNGDKNEGEWNDGKRDGQGTFTWKDGRTLVGEFKNERRWNGKVYDKNGEIIKKYVNGVRQLGIIGGFIAHRDSDTEASGGTGGNKDMAHQNIGILT